MAILINAIQGNFGDVTFTGQGDGSSTTITFSLEEAPTFSNNGNGMGFNFAGNYPIEGFVTFSFIGNASGQNDTSITTSISVHRSLVTLTFSSAPLQAVFGSPVGEISVRFNLLYGGH